MATRFGHNLYTWLIERGWEPAPIAETDNFDEILIGDAMLIDKISGETLSPYQALALHTNRTGEVYREDL